METFFFNTDVLSRDQAFFKTEDVSRDLQQKCVNSKFFVNKK